MLIGVLIILLLCLPLILTLLLIRMIRRRKKRETLDPSLKKDYSYASLVEPFSLHDNWLTCAILLTLAVVYICELVFAVEGSIQSPTPSLETLLALGGVSRNTVLHGDWYRLFTAPFLHGGLIHLLCNGIALYFAARILEKQIGRLWLLAVYFVSGLSGAFFSVMMHEDNVVSVGASGAIMGLFAAVMVVSYHASNEEKKHALRSFSLRIIIPAILPQASHIDYAAHFGGLIGGGLCALIMLLSWPQASLPRLRVLAILITGLGLIFTAISFMIIAHHYTEFKALGNCVASMKEAAKKGGVDPQKYIKENLTYLDSCVRFYIGKH